MQKKYLTLVGSWLFLFFLGLETTFACDDADKLAYELSIQAYNVNMDKAVLEQVANQKVPIVYRESTLPAQALQQNNHTAKPQDIKNKSSTLPYIAGLIPCHGLAGKQGDNLRKFSRVCPGNLSEWSDHQKSEHDRLMAQVKKEDHLIGALVESKAYSCTPVEVQKGGENFVVAYTDQTRSNTALVKKSEVNSTLIATVLASAGNQKVTADTDLVVVGNPKGKKMEINYDSKNGFRSNLMDQVRRGINSKWQELTGNVNSPIQHGDESLFGLNPLDDVFKCYGVDGHIQKFDLRKDNPRRTEALKDYARWIHSQSQYADIPIPTEELQKNRAEYLKKKFGIVLDSSNAWADYAVIRNEIKRLGGKIFDSPVHYNEVPRTDEKNSVSKRSAVDSCKENVQENSRTWGIQECLKANPQVIDLKQFNSALKVAERFNPIQSSCQSYSSDPLQNSNCLCLKIFGDPQYVGSLSDAQLRRIFNNISSLDKSAQFDFFKNLSQIGVIKAVKVLGRLASFNCGIKSPLFQ